MKRGKDGIITEGSGGGLAPGGLLSQSFPPSPSPSKKETRPYRQHLHIVGTHKTKRIEKMVKTPSPNRKKNTSESERSVDTRHRRNEAEKKCTPHGHAYFFILQHICYAGGVLTCGVCQPGVSGRCRTR